MAEASTTLRCPVCREDAGAEPAFYDPRYGAQWEEGDEYACAACGVRLVVHVTDDYPGDALASLREVTS